MIKLIFTFIFINLLITNPCFSKLDNDKLKISEVQVSEIAKNIRCLVCKNQSIESSNSEFAIDIKKMIRKKLASGGEKEEIFKFLKSKYGDYVLFDPPFQKNTIFLWIVPFLLMFIGIVLITIKHIKLGKK